MLLYDSLFNNEETHDAAHIPFEHEGTHCRTRVVLRLEEMVVDCGFKLVEGASNSY